MNVHADKSPALLRPLTLVGANARIIMGQDEAALAQLWRRQVRRFEAERPDKLVLELAKATEPINRALFERRDPAALVEGQKRLRHPALKWMGAVLDGRLDDGSLFEAEFSPTSSLTPNAARAAFMASAQHNLWAAQAQLAVLSVVTGDGGWVERLLPPTSLPASVLTAEKRFRRCVENGEPPSLFLWSRPRLRRHCQPSPT